MGVAEQYFTQNTVHQKKIKQWMSSIFFLNLVHGPQNTTYVNLTGLIIGVVSDLNLKIYICIRFKQIKYGNEHVIQL